MVDEVITKQELIDAGEDVQALEDVVNGEPGKLVKTRLGREVYTLASVPQINTMTREEVAAAVAPKANKAEVDTALALKAPQSSTYTKAEVDTTFAAYVGGRKAYTTLALAQAAQASLPANTAVEVTNDGESNGTYQWNGTTLTKSDYDPLTQAKNYADSNPLFKPKLLTSGQDMLALSNAGYYEVSDGLIADSLINTPTQAKTKYGVYEVQIVAIYNIIIFRPYGRDTNFYVNSSQENGVWSGWQTFSNNATLDTIFASKALLNDTLSATIDALTQTKYFGKQYSESQLAGDLIYGGAIPYAGYAGVTTSAISFNSVVARLWSKGAGDIEYRIYTGDAVEYNVNGALVVNNNINKHSYSGVITDFPRSDTGQAQTIVLDKVVNIAAGTPFLIAFKNVNLQQFGLAFSESKIGDGIPQGFVSSSEDVDWSSVAAISSSAASSPYNLYQAGFQLKITTAGSGGGGQIIEHKPELVLPPKIYTLANLQAHIYPEHLLPEPHTEYLHTMSALRGNQTNRGWVWDVLPSEGAGQMGFTWTVSDKQTGEPLSSASGLIMIANKDVAGTKNIMVIGDSYVNAGIMTQRLLDIAATDPLKVTLVGTRTTGGATNKHEGRPGWTVANYATNFTGNPFWIGGKVDFSQYIAANNLATPDIVFFELGVNDSFPMKTDEAVVDLTVTAFAQLDTIIASIKAQNPAVKIALLTPPTYADQDAFGHDYGSAYTAWRCNRNIGVWNRELIKRYKDSEPQNIYVVGSGYNVDTQANYPTATQQVNSHNSNMITVQSNSVHPADSGYKQIGDVMFAFMKTI